MKKDFLFLKKSRWLLFMLFALLGVSPAWAEESVTENFATNVLPDGWSINNTVNSSSYKAISLSSLYKKSGSYSLYASEGSNTYTNLNYVVLPEVTGTISLFARAVSNGDFGYLSIYRYSNGSLGTIVGSLQSKKSTSWGDNPWTFTLEENEKTQVAIVFGGLYVDEITVTYVPDTTPKPKTLSFDFTTTTATVTWTAGSSDGSETGWDLEYKAAGSDSWTEVHGIAKATTSYNITSLTPNTNYDVRVRALYDSESSDWKTGSFKTAKVATVAEGFTDDFESDNGWSFVNSSTNKWYRGTATNNGGSNALYISNDEGTTNAYTNNSATVSYATKYFSFAGGDYTVSYDWKALGESDSWDYLRVFLAADVEFTAGTLYSGLTATALPSGWIALDGGSYLSGKDSWQNKSVNASIPAGNYLVVFVWRNDGSSGSNPPAAIDNFSIVKQALSIPTGLAYSSLAAESVVLSWTANSDETEWQVKYGATGFDVTTEGTAVVASANPYTLTGLSAETTYDVYVRAKNGDNYSGWSTKVNFTTPEKYPKPTAVTSSSVAATTATISWTKNGTETSWEYSCTTSSEEPDVNGTYTSVDATSANLTSLTENTTYYVYVRAKVGEEHSAWSAVHSFTTTQTPVDLTIGSFADDFETANNWVFVNGTLTNAWAWGTATNNGGEKAMYISNDGGTSNSYGGANTMVYATKLFTLAQGKYDISYDWKANGEKNYDYLRVVIVPATTTLTASTTVPSGFSYSGLPTGWIAIDGGSQLSKTSDFTTKEVEATIETAGDYKVVFAWRNDADACNPPAAIDNFSIAFQACAKPTGVASSDVKGNKATLSWSAADETTWEVYISTESTKPADNQTATAAPTTNSYTFTGLTAETHYYAWVRAVKNTVKSDWVGVDFTTDVQYAAPTGLTIARQGTTATLTWTAGDDETAWEVVSSTESTADPDALTATEVTSATSTLDGLTVGSTYYVWVRAKYGDGDGEHSAWVDGTFSLTYRAAGPTSRDGSGITNVTFGTGAEVVNNSESLSSPYYGDYSAQIGGVTAGLQTTVNITYSTGNYPYTALIWVDWNQNYEFEGSEVVFVGKAASGTATQEATFNVSGSQAAGNYRMRIAAADSYYNNYNTMETAVNADPYVSGSNYAVVHDYTLKVNEAAAYSLAISGSDVTDNAIAFGTVKNTTTTKTFTITNDGAGDLEGISVVSSDNTIFTVSDTGFDLAAGATKDITVTFVKAEDDDYEESITVSHANVATSKVITVTATYVAPTPATIALTEGATAVGETVNFGTVGKAKSKTFTVTNSGEATLNITSIASSNTTDFTVTPASLEVAGGETGEFIVNFLWDGEALNAEKSATITLTSNAATSPTTFIIKGTRDNLWIVDFEGEDPLDGWENSGFTVKATAGSSNNVALTSKYAVSNYSGSNSTLVTPLLKATSGDKLTFDAYFCWGNDPMKVEYSTDGTDFDADGHTLYNFTGSPSFGQNGTANIEITAPITGEFYLRFTTCYSNAIDNIEGFKLAPAREHDAIIASSNIYSVGYQYKEYTASVTVREKASKDDEVVTAELWINGSKVATETDVTLTANDNKTISLSFTPDEEMADVKAYIKVYNENINLTSETSTINIYAATVLDETVGTFTTGNKPSMVVKYAAKNGWNTICMPFALTDEFLTELFGAGYKIYQFNKYDSENDVIAFQTASSFTAKKPYLVYIPTAASNPDGVKLFNVNLPSGTTPSYDSNSSVTFQGTYAPIAAGSLTDWYGVTNDGEIRPASDKASLKGFRAYFTGVPASATARISITDETTGITTIISHQEMEQGIYNLNGQRMQQTKKGLNIINGKIVIVK